MKQIGDRRCFLVEPEQAGLLIIDVQPNFLDATNEATERLLCRLEQLLLFAIAMEIPTIATLEQAAKDESAVSLPERLERVFPPHGTILLKRLFNFCDVGEGPRIANQFNATHPTLPPLSDPESLPPWKPHR